MCGEREFPWLIGHSPLLKEAKAGTQDRNPEAGIEAEVLEECCVVTCSPWFVQPGSLYSPAALPRSDAAPSKPGPLRAIINQEMHGDAFTG